MPERAGAGNAGKTGTGAVGKTGISDAEKAGISDAGKTGDTCYMYIVRCCDNSLYTGWTNHLKERIAAHNAGKGAKYTKSRRPVELVYFEKFETKEEAMSREFRVKRLTRGQKLKLIESRKDDGCI